MAQQEDIIYYTNKVKGVQDFNNLYYKTYTQRDPYFSKIFDSLCKKTTDYITYIESLYNIKDTITILTQEQHPGFELEEQNKRFISRSSTTSIVSNLYKLFNYYNYNILKKKDESEKKDKTINDLVKEITKKKQDDEYMTAFMDKNGFKNPNDLYKFIIKYKNHECKCNCIPIDKLTHEELKNNFQYNNCLTINKGLVNTCKELEEKISEVENNQIKNTLLEKDQDKFECKSIDCIYKVDTMNTYCEKCTEMLADLDNEDDYDGYLSSPEYTKEVTYNNIPRPTPASKVLEEETFHENNNNYNSETVDALNIKEDIKTKDITSEDKSKNKKKSAPKKNNVEDIYLKIKDCKNIEEEFKINNIKNKVLIESMKEIGNSRINKYNAMISLHKELQNKNMSIDRSVDYVKETLKEYLFLIDDKKYRRFFSKCKRLYELDPFISVNLLVNIKIISKCFTLIDDDFELLMKKIKNEN